MRTAEVVVVGAGVIGASIAYHLARDGAEVVLVDRARTPAGATASGASAGGVRQQSRAASELPLAVEAISRWPGLPAELGLDLGYRQDGMTICVDDPALLPALRAKVARERAAGVEIEVVEGEVLHRLIPGLAAGIVAGSYCRTDGHADPMRTTRAFSLAAERHGAHVLFGCAVQGLRWEGARVVGVETSRGPIACGTLVLAAGPWTQRIAAAGGVALPMLREGFLQMMVTARMPHLLDQVLGWVGHGISLKQAPTGGYVIGGAWPGQGDLDRYQTQLLPGSMARSAATAAALFPVLAQVPVVRAWVGTESFSQDDSPVISMLPEHPGLLVAAGFSGHGFAIAPAVGQRVAEWLSTGQVPETLRPLAVGRFVAGGGRNE